MSVAGHHLPIWFDEATGPDDGDVSVWNSATGRFESAPVVGGAVPDGTYVGGVIVAGAGIDDTGATDSTAAINAKIAAASVAGIAAGRMVRVRFPNGTFLTDGILAKPYTWLDFGDAVIKKRVDGTTPLNNAMLRAVPVPIAIASTVTNKALTSNVATLAVSADHDYVIGSIVVVAGVDATFNGTVTVTAVPTTTSFSYAKTAANVASTASGGTATRTTYYGTYRNMKVTGGTFDPNGHTCPASIINLIYCEDLEMTGTKVHHDPACVNWAFQVGGRRLTFADLQVRDGTEVFQDGFHIYHGQDITLHGGHYASGDDAIAIGGEPTDVYLSVDPDPIRHVTITGVTVDAKEANGIKIYSQVGANGPLWEVTNVTINGLTGASGVNRNGGIGILSHLDPTTGDQQIRHLSINGVDLDVGSVDHDDTNGYGIYIQSARDVALSDVSLRLTEGSAAVNGFDLAKVYNCMGIKLDRIRCPALGRRFGLDARESTRVTLSNSYIKATDATVLDAVHLQDCPDAKVLDNDIENVKNNIGGIAIVAGTTTTALITGNTVKHRALGLVAGDGLRLVDTAVSRLTLTGNDFTGSFRAADPAVLRAIASRTVKGNKALDDIPSDEPWTLVALGRSRFDAAAATTTTLNESGAGLPSGSLGSTGVFYLDPANWPGGVTAKLRMSNIVITNATAPVANFTVGLYPVSAPAGGAAVVSVTLGTVVAGSTAAVVAPASGTMTKVDSTEFDCPAAGFYTLGVVVSATMAASSSASVRATLQARAT